MNKLVDYKLEDISLNIINEGKEYITLKIFNNSPNDIHISLKGSRYISTINGILDLYMTEPSDFIYNDGTSILNESFIIIQLTFQKLNRCVDGDRIELKIKNIGDLSIVRENSEWYVNNFIPILSSKNQLDSLIEHFEVLEEKFGISLQNFSAIANNDKELNLFCEVIATSGEFALSSFAIEVGIYDKSNKIVHHANIKREKEDFMGFEIFHFGTLYLPISISNIGRIVFYPIKI